MSEPRQPGFGIDVADSFDALARRLVGRIGGPLADPFEPIVIVTPSTGVVRWLEQRIARELGIAANLDFVLPGRLASRIRTAARGTEHEPWELQALTGTIFALTNPHSDLAHRSPAVASLVERLSGRGSAMMRARYIADLFDRYLLHRPLMVSAWTDGHDVGGDGAPLARSLQWQPVLWRMVTEQLGLSPADRAIDELNAVVSGRVALGMDNGIHVFGLSAMSSDFIGLLSAVSATRAVQLYTKVSSPSIARSILDPFADLVEPVHPLLATWDSSQREGLDLLSRNVPETARVTVAAARDDAAVDTVLAAVQGQIAANSTPRPQALDGADQSIQFHSCPGEARQVDVLRDAILHALNDMPDLTEADVVVLCPTLSRFAPLIEAQWGPSAAHDSDLKAQLAEDGVIGLRYRVNNRSLRGAAPLLDAGLALLHLLDGRMAHSALSSFAALDPVRARFGWLDDDELATIDTWFERTRLRWGLDPNQRSHHAELPDDFARHTLVNSTEAVMFGVALPAGARLAGDADSTSPPAVRLDISQMDLAGAVSEFTNALAMAFERLASAGPMSMSVWAERLRDANESLFAVALTESWQWRVLNDLLDDLVAEVPDGSLLDLIDVADAIAARLDDAPGHRSFGSGDIIVDGPQALRSVPHDVVCLLGFDEGAVPSDQTTGDDLIAAHRQPGDRDRRSDAKQQLLDALLSARRRLIITWSGRNIHTNAEIPPSVALRELIDVVNTVAGVSDEQVITTHSRFTHDASNFAITAPWSFDPLAHAAATARLERPGMAQRALPARLDLAPSTSDQIRLVHLQQAITNPLRLFATETLDLTEPEEQSLPSDVLPVELHPLERWQLGTDLLAARLLGTDELAWVDARVTEGVLPPGSLAHTTLKTIDERAGGVLAAAQASLQCGPDELGDILRDEPLRIDLGVDDRTGQRRTITGSVDIAAVHGARDGGRRLIHMLTVSAAKADHRLRLWLHALVAARTLDESIEVLYVPRQETKTPKVDHFMVEPDNPAIADAIGWAMAIHDDARREVVPLFAETSAALGTEADWASARKAWRSPQTNYVAGDVVGRYAPFFFDGWESDDLRAPSLRTAELARALWTHVGRTISDVPSLIHDERST